MYLYGIISQYNELENMLEKKGRGFEKFMGKYIFLDANIYINTRYSFENWHMKKFSELIVNDGLILLSCSTCIGEVEKHIKMDLEGAVKELNKVLKRGEFAAIRNEYLYKDRLAKLDEQSTIEFVVQKFHNFLDKNHVECFSLRGIDIEEIMQDYFEMRAPFENQKPNEFKDAIMIKALKKYQKELREKIVVVSLDNGFRQAFSGNNNFIIFEKLVDFIQYQQRTDSIQEAFTEYFANGMECESIQDELDKLIRTIMYSFDEREEFEIIDLENDDIKYEFNYVEVDRDERARVFLTVDFCIRIKSTYLDINSSFYDKAEEEYIVKNYIETEEIHQFEHEIILDFTCKEIERNIELEETKYELMFVGINDNTYDISIDLSEDDTLLRHINSRKVMEREAVIRCSECGKILGISDNGCCHNYRGEPICDSCAATDDDGFICSICGLKNPYVRMGNSGQYCIDCEKEYDI